MMFIGFLQCFSLKVMLPFWKSSWIIYQVLTDSHPTFFQLGDCLYHVDNEKKSMRPIFHRLLKKDIVETMVT